MPTGRSNECSGTGERDVRTVVGSCGRHAAWSNNKRCPREANDVPTDMACLSECEGGGSRHHDNNCEHSDDGWAPNSSFRLHGVPPSSRKIPGFQGKFLYVVSSSQLP